VTTLSRTTDTDRARRRGPAVLLAVPTFLWYVGFLILPLVVLAVMSVGERSPNGGYAPGLTLEQYANLGTRITPLTNTLGLAALNTVICLFVAFPVAYTLALKVRGSWKLLLVALVIVPFWTSFLIRTYAWMTLLGANGVPQLLGWIGFGDVQLLNTPFAVSLGIVYNYLPLMVLPIYVSLERLDRRLLEASADLGARPASTFVGVTLPLSLPGVMTGFSLVTILLLGEYLIPSLLGGGKVFFIGNALVDLFLQSRNWPFGSAIAVTLVVASVIVLAVANRVTARVSGTRQVDLV
jgi:spermidine/putrescine transport system permease protein